MSSSNHRLPRSWKKHLLVGVGLLVFVLLGFAQRTVFSYAEVFVDDDVLFRGNDAWYHARVIDHEAVGRGSLLQHDPYLRMPRGDRVRVAPLYGKLAATAAKIRLGFRNADPAVASDMRTVRATAAWMPAVLGSLAVLPMFAIARRLWGGIAGWTAAVGFLAMPGSMLSRSLVGFTDHHVAEVLFSITAIAFLVLATAVEEPGSNRSTRRRAILAMLGGASLAAYQLCWVAGMFQPLVVSSWIVAASFLLWLRPDTQTKRYPSERAAFLTALTGLVAFGLVTAMTDGIRVTSSSQLINGLLVLAALGVVSIILVSKRSPKFALALVGMAAAVGVYFLFGPTQLAASIQRYMFFLQPRSIAKTVMEATPMFETGSTLGVLWRELGFGWLVAIPGFLIIGWRALKDKCPGNLLIVAWGLAVLALTLSQVRFTYYLTLVSILATSALVGALLQSQATSSSLQKEAAPNIQRDRSRKLAQLLTLAAIVLLIVGPNLRKTVLRMMSPTLISAPWVEALDWLRTNTPEPFPTQDCYFETHQRGECSPEYGVLSWWDHGYWITQRARRVPFANPAQAGARWIAPWLLSETQNAVPWLQARKANYILVDSEMVLFEPQPGRVMGKFSSIVKWARIPRSDFFESALIEGPDGKLLLVNLYHEKYFRSLLVHTLLTGGDALQPFRTPVLELETRGGGPRIVRSAHPFDSYEAAQAFLKQKQSEEASDKIEWTIASTDPLQTPTPLEKVEQIQEVFTSQTIVASAGSTRIPRIRIVEVKEAEPKR